MKKKIYVLLSIFLLSTLIGCSDEISYQKKTNSNKNNAIDLTETGDSNEYFPWSDHTTLTNIPDPKVKSNKVNIENEDEFYISLTISGVTQRGYESYATACKKSGFTTDYSYSDSYYYAENTSGCSLDINYSNQKKEMRISITLERTTEATTEKNTEASTVQKTKKQKETSNNTPKSGIRKELSEFLDSYETFINEYTDFMKKYDEADSNDQTKMLTDYLNYCDKYANFAQKYDDIRDTELNNDELAYYIEVQNRVNKKLLSE